MKNKKPARHDDCSSDNDNTKFDYLDDFESFSEGTEPEITKGYTKVKKENKNNKTFDDRSTFVLGNEGTSDHKCTVILTKNCRLWV